MNIHWIANYITPPPKSLSGGDRIMVECVRRWSREMPVTVYGTRPTGELLNYMGLHQVRFVEWREPRWHLRIRPLDFLTEALYVRHQGAQMQLDNAPETVIVSSSDFLTDTLPAQEARRVHPKITWAATFYIFAPTLWDWIRRKPTNGLSFCLYQPIQAWMLKCLMRSADLIITTVEEDRQKLIRRGRRPESVFAIRGGVDIELARQVPAPPNPVYDAVFIGRFHPQKGPLELVQVWSMVRTYKPDAKLVMIGSGPLEAKVKAAIEKYGLQDAIYLAGFRDGEEKYKLIRASRIVLHPAIYEVGGMAAAEALVCGLPGVLFDHPELRNYYPRGFLRVPPGDLESFAKNVALLLAEQDLYAKLQAEAMEEAPAWDWNYRAQLAREALEGVVKQRNI